MQLAGTVLIWLYPFGYDDVAGKCRADRKRATISDVRATAHSLKYMKLLVGFIVIVTIVVVVSVVVVL